MKNLILTTITVALSLISARINAQWCNQPNPDFCPGNYFSNGNFETVTANPAAQTSNDINKATGWSAIWPGTSLADLTCGNTTHGTGPAPTPSSGAYSGMWIMNRGAETTPSATYREAMYNKLTTTIGRNTGSYTFNFDMAYGGNNYTGQPVKIALYGVYNPLDQLTSAAPSGQNTPTNLNLWQSVTGVQVVYLGSVSSPTPFTNNWSNQTLTFSTNTWPTSLNNITHLMVTKDDEPLSWRKAYVNFDNFCLQRSEPPIPPCCQTPLTIYNVAGTPNPLPVTQMTSGGVPYSYAKETFQLYSDATTPITEMKVVITDIQYNYNYDACAQCVKNPALWGSVVPNLSNISGSNGLNSASITPSKLINTYTNSREAIWANPNGAMLTSGDKISVGYILPPASDIPCCATSVKICSNIIWKDANCNVCDSLTTCSVIELGSDSHDDASTSDCNCGRWSPINNDISISRFPSSGFKNKEVKCGRNVRLEYKRLGSTQPYNYTFKAPSYLCPGANCKANYNWEILQNGAVVSGGTGTGNRFDFRFPSKGNYTIRFNVNCGDKECDKCEINVTLY